MCSEVSGDIFCMQQMVVGRLLQIELRPEPAFSPPENKIIESVSVALKKKSRKHFLCPASEQIVRDLYSHPVCIRDAVGWLRGPE